jgi:hypothetical protein
VTQHKFAVGDRVRYTNGQRPDWEGKLASITAANVVFGDLKYDVWFDEPHSGKRHHEGRGIPEASLEKLIVIDPKRPVQTTEDPPRQCRTIGILERTEGVVTLLLSVPYHTYDGISRDPEEVEIGLDGRTTKADALGNALRFVNEPKVARGFYAMDKLGPLANTRGRTKLSDLFYDYKFATHALEIVTIDGEPTEAKIHARPTP